MPLSAALRALARSGPPFHALIPFATPLFEAYDVDVERVEALLTGSPDPFADEVLLVVETARLLWAYCALPPDEAHERLPGLEATLLPGALRDDERAAFHVLVAELEEHFHDLDEDARNAVAPPYEALLERYRSHYPPDDPRDDEAEAIAVFARPLLERDGLDDPDELDRRTDLAHALWEVAHADDRTAALAVAQRAFPDERDLALLLDDLVAQFRAARP